MSYLTVLDINLICCNLCETDVCI